MTQATKSLAIIFVSLLVITGLVKWTDSSSSSQAFQSTLVEADLSQVDRMVIEAPTQNREIILEKEGSSWNASSGSAETSYPADSGAIARSINQLNDLSIQAVATRDPGKYTRFKVDSTGTTVSLYNSDQLLSSIVIGAPQVVSRQQYNTYVRPADGEAVYAVDGFLSPTFGKDLEGWRDKTVWSFEEDRISQIDFLMPADSSYTIIRANDGSRSWISDGDTLRTTPVSRITNGLSSLTADGFVEGQDPRDFGMGFYIVHVILDDGTQKTLRINRAEEDEDVYHAAASEFPYTFTLNKSSFNNSVLQARDELLQN